MKFLITLALVAGLAPAGFADGNYADGQALIEVQVVKPVKMCVTGVLNFGYIVADCYPATLDIDKNAHVHTKAGCDIFTGTPCGPIPGTPSVPTFTITKDPCYKVAVCFDAHIEHGEFKIAHDLKELSKGIGCGVSCIPPTPIWGELKLLGYNEPHRGIDRGHVRVHACYL